MESSVLLKKLGINPEEPVLLITAEEAIENLLEAIEEYCPDLKVEKMAKEDVNSLLYSYARCVSVYHPENYHQERGALLENFDMLKKYGLSGDDHAALDFT